MPPKLGSPCYVSFRPADHAGGMNIVEWASIGGGKGVGPDLPFSCPWFFGETQLLLDRRVRSLSSMIIGVLENYPDRMAQNPRITLNCPTQSLSRGKIWRIRFHSLTPPLPSYRRLTGYKTSRPFSVFHSARPSLCNAPVILSISDVMEFRPKML